MLVKISENMPFSVIVVNDDDARSRLAHHI